MGGHWPQWGLRVPQEGPAELGEGSAADVAKGAGCVHSVTAHTAVLILAVRAQ